MKTSRHVFMSAVAIVAPASSGRIRDLARSGPAERLEAAIGTSESMNQRFRIVSVFRRNALSAAAVRRVPAVRQI
jgi:hypothetical protein